MVDKPIRAAHKPSIAWKGASGVVHQPFIGSSFIRRWKAVHSELMSQQIRQPHRGILLLWESTYVMSHFWTPALHVKSLSQDTSKIIELADSAWTSQFMDDVIPKLESTTTSLPDSTGNNPESGSLIMVVIVKKRISTMISVHMFACTNWTYNAMMKFDSPQNTKCS